MSIIDHIRDAAKVARQIDNIELYKQILDLQGEALEIQEQLLEKTKRIKELEEALVIKQKIAFVDSAYFETNAEGNPTGDPYCPRCYDIDKKLCHLNSLGGNMQCPNCHIKYFTFVKK